LPHPGPRRRPDGRARVYVRGHDGVRQEIVRFGRTRHEAESALEAAVAVVIYGGDAVLNAQTPGFQAARQPLRKLLIGPGWDGTWAEDR
jgi:ribonucleotide monophosphatase NagD (HAD superfamily)